MSKKRVELQELEKESISAAGIDAPSRTKDCFARDDELQELGKQCISAAGIDAPSRAKDVFCAHQQASRCAKPHKGHVLRASASFTS